MSYGPVLYMVAQLAEHPCGLEFNWTSQAFTDLDEARQEETDAHNAGHVQERVFEFRLARRLLSLR